jgi:N-formylglutamate amidohydrolase
MGVMSLVFQDTEAEGFDKLLNGDIKKGAIENHY